MGVVIYFWYLMQSHFQLCLPLASNSNHIQHKHQIKPKKDSPKLIVEKEAAFVLKWKQAMYQCSLLWTELYFNNNTCPVRLFKNVYFLTQRSHLFENIRLQSCMFKIVRSHMPYCRITGTNLTHLMLQSIKGLSKNHLYGQFSIRQVLCII